jgi:hypothetical protein
MASEKARYWMAVAAAALFLGNSFMAGHRHSIAVNCSQAQRISSEAARFATLAQAIFSDREPGFVQAQTATVCAQTRFALAQTNMARRQAALARVQAERVRLLANRAVVASSPRSIVINVPEVPVIADDGTI